MINANELRIGNYVSFGKDTYLDGRKDLYVVEGLNGKSARIHRDGHISGLVDYKNINPIPIKSEILEKATFVYDADKVLVYGKFLYWLKGADVLQIALGYAPVTNVPCKYVHQLQNIIFALSGKEIEFTP